MTLAAEKPSSALRPLGTPVSVTAPLSVEIVTDANMNGEADRGDTLRYHLVLAAHNGTVTGVAFGITLDANTTLVPGSVVTTPIARPDTYSAIGNVGLSITAPGVLANDGDADGDSLTASTISPFTANGGGVAVSADGSFAYEPPLGFEGTDSFTYLVTDTHGKTDTGTVSITVSGMIWFVNPDAPFDGSGRLSAPFKYLSSLAAVNDGGAGHPAAGDAIFLYASATNHAGPLTLLDSQKLVGQGAGASLATILGITPPTGSATLPSTGGSRPVLAATGATCLTLAHSNLVRGLNVSCTSGTALAGSSFTAFTASDASVSATGGAAISLASGSLAVSLTSVSASAGTNGLVLQSTTGTFTVTGDGGGTANGSGGTISGTSDAGVSLTSAAGVTLNRMNVSTSATDGVHVIGSSVLTLNLCGVSSSTGAGVYVSTAGTDAAVTVIQNSTLSSNSVHVQFAQTGASSNKFKVLNCTMNSATFDAISAKMGAGTTASGLLYGMISGNTVGTQGTQHSGSKYGSAIYLEADGSGTANFLVQNNLVHEVINESDLSVLSVSGTGPLVLEAKNNIFYAPTGGTNACNAGVGQCDGDTFRVIANARSVCADIAGNQAYTPSNGAWAYSLSAINLGTFTLEGTQATAAAQLIATNIGTPVLVGPSVTVVAPGTCVSLPDFLRAAGDGPAALSLAPDPPARTELPAARTETPVGRVPVVASPARRPTARVQPLVGDTINLSIGDLPVGHPVFVTFDATVKSTYPPGTTQVCTQGLVTGGNVAPVFTDDPLTVASADATCMALAKIHGDVNDDGHVDVADVFYLINYLFAGGSAPLAPANVNGTGGVDVADVFYLINYLFAGGPAPQ